MKKFWKVLALGAAALLLIASLSGCGTQDAGSKDDTSNPASENADLGLISEGKLVMGTNAFFPPFEYKENGEVVGVDAEIVAKIAEKLNLDLEIKGDIEFESLPESLKAKEIDLIAAGYTARPDREEVMDFSDSYYTALQTIIVKADSDIASLDDIKDKNLRIGGQSGTTGLFEAEELTSAENIKGFANGAQAVEDLLNGNLDLVIIDNNPAKEYKAEHEEELKLLENQFDEELYVIGVPKGNTALLKAVNDAIKEMKEDGSMQTILDKYIR